MEASIGQVLISIITQFEIGDFEYTEGKPQHHVPVSLSELSLLEKANKWGISVRVAPCGMCRCHGHYDRDRKEIRLAANDAKAFLHGLAHTAIERLNVSITHTRPQWQEIISELAAAALYQIVMQKSDKWLSNSYSFILFNAIALNKTPFDACLDVFAETEKIINLILE
jgi:hypothetical protein